MDHWQWTQLLNRLSAIERKLNNNQIILAHITWRLSVMSTVLVALQQADSDLADAVAQNVTDTGAILTDVQQLLANAANNPEATAVQAAVTDIQAKIATIKQNNQALEVALVPPAPPATTAGVPNPTA